MSERIDLDAIEAKTREPGITTNVAIKRTTLLALIERVRTAEAALSGNADAQQVEDKPDGPEGEEDAGNNGVITGHGVDDTPHRFGFGPCSCMSCGR